VLEQKAHAMSDLDEYYAALRQSGRLYVSRSFPDNSPVKLRIMNRIIDGNEGLGFATIKKDIQLRESPPARFQIKATVYEDDRRVQKLSFQKFTKEGPKEEFTFRGEEINVIVEFMQSLRTVTLSSEDKVRMTDADIRNVTFDGSQLRTMLAQHPEVAREIVENQTLTEDIIAVGYRRLALKHFEELLNDSDFFQSECQRLDTSPESVWQQFFEGNQWIFGYGLSYQFMTGLDEVKLETIVQGFSVAGPGKRTDALMKTRGRIGSLCFVEIKRHDRDLLAKEYRSGAWSPAADLAGGVAQIQSTVHSAVERIGKKLTPTLKGGVPTGEELFNVEPRSVLVMGRLSEFETPTGINADKVRSFELYRRNTWRPEIITYDELLERARFIVEHSQQAAKPEGETKPAVLPMTRGTKADLDDDIPFD
jgi:hypothetical protein